MKKKIQRCRVCGCTELQACEGGCWWIEPDLCSSCNGHGTSSAKPTHDIVAIKESSNRTGKRKIAIKLRLRGAKGGTHAVLASTPPFPDGDRRIAPLYAAFQEVAASLQSKADYLCTCPPPGETRRSQ